MNSTNSSKKKDYIWNTASGIINACEAVIISWIVTRVTGVTDAGIFSIAFALSNLFLTFGKFGIRTFQVTDVSEQYSFGTYFTTRIFTTCLMMGICGGYLIIAVNFRDYSFYKAAIILLTCSLYAVESLEDVMAGFLQNRGFLYKGAMMFCIRWAMILVSFITMLLCTKNIIVSLGTALAISVLVLVMTAKFIFGKVVAGNRLSCSISSVKSLVLTTFPLFGSLFLTYYINNSAKYAIDGVLSDQIQAFYGYISMPVFVTSLFTSFIYQPYLVSIANQWKEGDVAGIRKQIRNNLMIILGISSVVVAGSALCGIPFLSWFYGVALKDYRLALIILMITSGFLAAINFTGVIINVMRLQKLQLYGNIVIGIAAFWLLPIMVIKYEVIGATLAYMGLVVLLFAYLLTVILTNAKAKNVITVQED